MSVILFIIVVAFLMFFLIAMGVHPLASLFGSLAVTIAVFYIIFAIFNIL